MALYKNIFFKEAFFSGNMQNLKYGLEWKSVQDSAAKSAINVGY